MQSLNREKRVMQQRDRQRKRNEQVAKTPSCPGSLGKLTLGAIGRLGQRPLHQKKKETTRRTSLSYSSGHKELSSFCSREFHVCDDVPVNSSQEATEKAKQSSALMGKSSGLNLKDVIRHWPRGGAISVRDECTSWCTSEGPRQMAEVRSLVSQLHNVNGRSASSDRIILCHRCWRSWG